MALLKSKLYINNTISKISSAKENFKYGSLLLYYMIYFLFAVLIF